MSPRIRALLIFVAAILIGDLLHWLWWILRYVIAPCIVLWLSWLFAAGHITGT